MDLLRDEGELIWENVVWSNGMCSLSGESAEGFLWGESVGTERWESDPEWCVGLFVCGPG